MIDSSRFDRFRQALDERRAAIRFRSLLAVDTPSGDGASIHMNGREYLNACSNDYLNLSTHSAIKTAVIQGVTDYGVGSTASRLVSGTSQIHLDFERELAEFQHRDKALLFSSGYLTNISMISALLGRNSTIFIDKLAHNSLIQGARLSGADIKRFRHNDCDHLEQLLKSAGNEPKLIITEGVFSMDGDIPDLLAVSELSDQYDALLYVDEAHSFGLYGEGGRGLCYNMNRVDLVGCMFGKAMGSMGGSIAASDLLINYLINTGGGFIYSTAPPPAQVAGLQASLKIIQSMDVERDHVKKLSMYLRSELNNVGYDTISSESQIIPVLIGSEHETMALSQFLLDEGILAGAIRPPTVPEGSSRIRLTLTAAHTYDHVDTIVDVFHRWEKTR